MPSITLEDKAFVVVCKMDGDPAVLIPPNSPLLPVDVAHILEAIAKRLKRDGL